MTLLVVGAVLFLSVHMIPSVVPLRAALFNQLGEKAYMGVYSLIALAGFGLIIYGKAYADFIPVWNPPEWTRHVTWLTMVPAMILIGAAYMPGNIKRFTPHPMMWSVLIWASTHLAANGDQASIILFGAFAAFSVIHIISANARGATRQTEVLPLSSDIKIVVVGLVSYAIFAVAHPYMFKVAAFL
ncbi:MAG TPA: NnrU family protein [Pseudomonadales bacterium]|jgi:uncharacterized membrane protein|nr:NnrU family protein [Gammaproteobacteria bacterium]MDP6025208.1 NnrU family protein [Pseudomonadales bacterium]MDP6314733.1 NnrU family protein [Pseudomonadales bacterium]MDP7313801.1 NnrU family protein [Pseudomonadales bacterium]MDP7575627.1 NnrU family protein [Pseudomonadales bacterium]|tara:strand:- start:957 stop:1514 length:558 start_codon:yes stop_codon:yes gene_type:complete